MRPSHAGNNLVVTVHPARARSAQGDLFAKPMNVVSWRDAAADGAMLTHMPQQPEQSRPVLRVIKGGRDQLLDEIDSLAADLCEIQRRLAAAQEELGRLMALRGSC